jgi:bifunctional UDP-N-acetylglucosamine pyrophosphorylase / glucosamine-1-phosphate N-acetyltransferase
MADTLAAVVMAGGLGTRMRSARPKHLHPLLGRRMVDWVVETARGLDPDQLVVVASPETAGTFDGVAVAVQEEPLGTGDAVRRAGEQLGHPDADVLVLNGDVPALRGEVLSDLVAAHRREEAAATVLSFEPADPRHYGRIVRGRGDRFEAIVEAAEADEEQREIAEVNSGMYVFAGRHLWPALQRLEPHEHKDELYITDVVHLFADDGLPLAAFKAPDPDEAEGVNTRAELAVAAALLRERINLRHMLAGATIVDPATTWIDDTVSLERDSVVHPFTVLRGKTSVGEGAEIGPHVVAVDAEVGPRALVGPFCYLRPGTLLGADSKAGTFVEIKNTDVGAGAKVPHLSYIGDAEIGEETNIGAGAITGNYPHDPDVPKQRTKIGRNVRTAIHNAFVAPVEIGDDSWTAAGSVITDDVPPGSLAGFPPRQVTKEGYVRRKRDGS